MSFLSCPCLPSTAPAWQESPGRDTEGEVTCPNAGASWLGPSYKGKSHRAQKSLGWQQSCASLLERSNSSPILGCSRWALPCLTLPTLAENPEQSRADWSCQDLFPCSVSPSPCSFRSNKRFAQNETKCSNSLLGHFQPKSGGAVRKEPD